MDPAARPPPFRRLVGFFRRHPVLLLLCFSPGIPEYLSGSSSFAGLAVSPASFFLFLALNLGLYGPGVLLVREAVVRWKKGWAAVLCLGAAYGLLEEGTALSTLFDSKASVVQGLGYYGHFLGVNWVWLIGILPVHIVFSIGLPILLLGLALPETRGRPLLTRRQIAVAFGILAVDILLLALVTHYYPVGFLWQFLAVVVAGGLTYVAFRLPRTVLDPTSETPRYPPRACLVLGLAFYPLLLLIPGIGETTPLGAPAVGVLDVLAVGALFLLVRRVVGRSQNEPQLVMLSLGVLIPILVFGLLAQFSHPIVLVADVLFGAFFYTLWRRYRPAIDTVLPSVPVGAT